MINKTNPYLENSIQTASPGQLLLMLYDAGIKQCRLGIDAIEQSKVQQANTALIKCQDIIQEMAITLDQESELATQLMPLYDYFLYLLREANIKKDTAPVQEVLGYLKDLREAWHEAVQMVRNASVRELGQTGARAHG